MLDDDQTIKPITHNTYFGGQVQSLGFVNQTGHDATVGVILPGEYDFGEAIHEEHITITSGSAVINGQRYEAGETCIVKAGDHIHIEVRNCPASYLCVYR